MLVRSLVASLPPDSTLSDAAARLRRLGWVIRHQDEDAITASRGHRLPILPWVAYSKSPQQVIVTRVGDSLQMSWSVIAQYVPNRVALQWVTGLQAAFPGATLVPAKGRSMGSAPVCAVALELVVMVVLAGLLAQGVKTYLVQPFVVATAHLSSTAAERDMVLVYKGPGVAGLTRPGRVVALRGDQRTVLSRVIAAGPAKVLVENGRLIVDGQLVEEPNATRGSINWDYDVPEGSLVLAMDVTDSPADYSVESREAVMGVVFATYYPFEHARFLLSDAAPR